ncbi:hypothetical protein [Streptococcus halichoeri]|uniref:hypothetical protein n=1 Tax=Streptococcus halichoeri TaxID=254785 RepID=UPI001C8E0B02|nr:hypothetical protein [Streptococcus halichoeri]
MIKREIIVEYYINLKTRKAGIDREDVEEDFNYKRFMDKYRLKTLTDEAIVIEEFKKMI